MRLGTAKRAMDMGNSDTRGFRALKSGSAILMDAQNSVYDEAGA